MVVKKSGICKVEGCDKLQVRDGFCQQCGQHFLQKTIISKLDEVSSELAKIKTVEQKPVEQKPVDNISSQLLIEILNQQTMLLKGVIDELKGLKLTTINQQPNTSPITSQVPTKTKKIIDDDNLFIPSVDSINLSGEINVVENTNTTNSSKKLTDIADKLNSLTI